MAGGSELFYDHKLYTVVSVISVEIYQHCGVGTTSPKKKKK